MNPSPAPPAAGHAWGNLNVDEMLFRALAERIGAYLDTVDKLAVEQPCSAAGEARRLVAAWRALLRQHEPTGRKARCSGCGRPHGSRRHAGRTMCTVWRVAVAFFVRRVARDR
jgi:ribosomal protein S14